MMQSNTLGLGLGLGMLWGLMREAMADSCEASGIVKTLLEDWCGPLIVDDEHKVAERAQHSLAFFGLVE